VTRALLGRCESLNTHSLARRAQSITTPSRQGQRPRSSHLGDPWRSPPGWFRRRGRPDVDRGHGLASGWRFGQPTSGAFGFGVCTSERDSFVERNQPAIVFGKRIEGRHGSLDRDVVGAVAVTDLVLPSLRSQRDPPEVGLTVGERFDHAVQRRSHSSFAFPAVAWRAVPKHGAAGGDIWILGGGFPAGGHSQGDCN